MTFFSILLISSILWVSSRGQYNPQTRGCTRNFNEEECLVVVQCEWEFNYVKWYETSKQYNDYPCFRGSVNYYYNNYLFGAVKYVLRHFTDLNLSTNVANTITILDASSNDFTQIPIIPSSMPHLIFLNVSRNLLTEARLYNKYPNARLTEIDLSHNTINTINVDHSMSVYSSLKKIDLSHNYLVTISYGVFDSFPQLEHLDLSNNFIDNLNMLSFEGIKNLIYLNMKNNRLVELNSSLLRFTKLKKLDISENKIEEIKKVDFEKLVNLEVLDLNSNVITLIEGNVFANMFALYDLDLSNNLINEVDKNVFLNLTSLKQINLSRNHLKSLQKDLFKDNQIISFNIKDNNLEGSLVRGTFNGFKYLTELDLSFQILSTIEDFAFDGLENLNALLLNNNKLSNLYKKSFANLENLENLDLSNNQLTNVEFGESGLRNLKSLLLQKNLLTQIKSEFFNGLYFLQFLDLSNNQISNLQSDSFKSLNNLINFHISNNPINGTLEESTFDGLNSLPNLDISGTLLTAIKNGSFKDMAQLKLLNASHGKIVDLEYNLFLKTGMIEIIDLSFNKLEDFNVNTTELVNVDKIILRNNRFKSISASFFKGILRLTEIILSHNELELVDEKAFGDQRDIRILDLSYNPSLQLSTGQFRETQNLATLLLSGVKSNITFTQELKLTNLDMSHSNIRNLTTVRLSKLPYLDELALSNNNISKLDITAFSGVKELRKLDISFNRINFIQPGVFKDNPLLYYLNVSHNMLTTVSYGIFTGLIYLETIDISYNEVNDLKSERFYEVSGLSVLIADHNNIHDVNPDDFAGTSLKKLSIGGNPLPCHVLVNLKKADTSFEITALNIDDKGGVENVNGISCNIDRNIITTTQQPKQYFKDKVLLDIKDILQNISSSYEANKSIASKNESEQRNDEKILLDIRSILLNMSSNNLGDKSVATVTKNYSVFNFDKVSRAVDDGNGNITLLLKEISKINTNTNALLDRLLKVLASDKVQNKDAIYIPPTTPKENITVENVLNYIHKMQSELENSLESSIAIEKQNIINELDNRISNEISILNTQKERSLNTDKSTQEAYSSNNNLDSKSFVFIEVCVGLILVILVVFILYKIYNSGVFVPNIRSISTRQLSDDMDNSAL